MTEISEGTQGLPTSSLTENLGLNELGERRIEPETISYIVNKFGEYFHVPKETIEVASQTPTFIANRSRIQAVAQKTIEDEIAAMYDTKSPLISQQLEDLKASGIDILSAKQNAYTQALAFFNAELDLVRCFTVSNGSKVESVYLNAAWSAGEYSECIASLTPDIEHEFAHVLSSRKDQSHGFYYGPRDQRLDEAATQVLVLAKNNPTLKPSELFTKIKSGSIKTPYALPVAQLLFFMSLTTAAEEPVGFQQLADYYFQNDEDSSLNKALFLMDTNAKIPAKLRPISMTLMNELQKSEEK